LAAVGVTAVSVVTVGASVAVVVVGVVAPRVRAQRALVASEMRLRAAADI
jgi:hypothetical protein